MKRIEEISLKEKDMAKLKEYPLHDILCTESQIYYYKKDRQRNSILLKKLFELKFIFWFKFFFVCYKY